jgi:hypothetical protein
MNYNASNPLIHHASISLEKEEIMIQLLMNRLAKRIIKTHIKDDAKPHLIIITQKDIRIA